MKQKKIKVFLKPEDFVYPESDIVTGFFFHPDDCPGRRALVRHFDTQKVRMGVHWCDVYENTFRILNDGFHRDDAEYIMQAYADPNCDTEYYITLMLPES